MGECWYASHGASQFTRMSLICVHMPCATATVAQIADEMRSVLQTQLSSVRARIQKYLVNADTQRILFRPIKVRAPGSFHRRVRGWGGG